MRPATMPTEPIAETVHEAVSAWCRANGQPGYPTWDEAEPWMRQSTVESVAFVLENPSVTPEDQHQQWLDQKRADGWVYGPEKDETKKTHPAMVPYAELPEFEQRKDALINAIILALADRRD